MHSASLFSSARIACDLPFLFLEVDQDDRPRTYFREEQLPRDTAEGEFGPIIIAVGGRYSEIRPGNWIAVIVIPTLQPQELIGNTKIQIKVSQMEILCKAYFLKCLSNNPELCSSPCRQQ
ncbi:hypothetical protein [uncultured Microbulbifer sp.]|uniref:hypothetical protein n=1 Tax=uncultured Microbulbifer sp. TaxID=348147 RepID=UPI0025DCCC57|nr:hypothetical protein [uncultured Microbulbifer sp.]